MENERPEVVIESLNIRFDIEAGAQEREFARLFQKYIQLFATHQRDQAERARDGDRERALHIERGH